MRAFTLISLCLATVYIGSSVAKLSEKELASEILANYQVVGRPVLDPKTKLNIYTRCFLTQIMNQDDNSLQVVVYWIQRWKDEYIHWNPEDYGGVDKIMIPDDKLWRPDTYNFYAEFYTNNYDQFRNMEVFLLWVYHDGTVIYQAVEQIRQQCTPRNDYKRHKSCHFSFGTISLDINEMDYIFEEDITKGFNMTYYMPTVGLNIASQAGAKSVSRMDIPTKAYDYPTFEYYLEVDIDNSISGCPAK